MSYKKCRKHPDCRKIKSIGHIMEIVNCPFCGSETSTSNPCNWCATCYCSFKHEAGYVHFSKSFEKTTAQKWAIAFAKCGGISFGKITETNNTPD